MKFINLNANKRLLMAGSFTFAQATPKHWYCSKKGKGCKARIYLSIDELQVLFIDNEHNHEPPVYQKVNSGYYVKISG